jgi:hypothetical protein
MQPVNKTERMHSQELTNVSHLSTPHLPYTKKNLFGSDVTLSQHAGSGSALQAAV